MCSSFIVIIFCLCLIIVLTTTVNNEVLDYVCLLDILRNSVIGFCIYDVVTEKGGEAFARY